MAIFIRARLRPRRRRSLPRLLLGKPPSGLNFVALLCVDFDPPF
jgi:hypothetical protein